MQYRRKPKVVEAFEVTGEMCFDKDSLPEWVRQFARQPSSRTRIHLDTSRGHDFLFRGRFVVRSDVDTPLVYRGEDFHDEFEPMGEK